MYYISYFHLNVVNVLFFQNIGCAVRRNKMVLLYLLPIRVGVLKQLQKWLELWLAKTKMTMTGPVH